MPKVSVIVPVYNTEGYLSRCINSILSQSYTDFELLLIDDGSRDNSGAICDHYATRDSRVRVFHKENGGASSARNVGLENARGEWITFCDSDDFVYENWLRNFVENLTDVDMVSQGIRFVMISKDVKDVGFNYYGDRQRFMLASYHNNNVGYLVIRCFKRSLIEGFKLFFNERYVVREDEEFCLRYIALCEKIMAVQNVGYHYFVPDFNKKYSLCYSLELCDNLLSDALYLYEYEFNDHIRDYINLYTGVLLKTFVKRCKISDFKKYKCTVGHFVHETDLPIVVKKIFYYDFTLILSSIILYMYSLYVNIKSLIINKSVETVI